jgi:curli biogenesis system outer membrane secretion channel CsgG
MKKLITQILFHLTLFPTLFAGMDIIAGERPRETVSVLYFENISKNRDYDWLSKGMADMLITDLAGGGEVDVVERGDLKKVLEEQQLSLTGITDDRKALELGRLMSARRLIYGSFIIQGESAVMNGRLTGPRRAG